jgi:hypothetical protein
MMASPLAAGRAFLALASFIGLLAAWASAKEADTDSARPKTQRGFRTFLPKPGESIDDPASQVVQVLLDRQDKGDFESYMVQVLFRGKPAERTVRSLPDRVEIDFYDTGKPAMRLAKIRGGVVEASSLDEFFYKENPARADADGQGSAAGARGPGGPRVKRMVRLTLYMHEKAELKFRDTLDRTLIHFRLDKQNPAAK